MSSDALVFQPTEWLDAAWALTAHKGGAAMGGRLGRPVRFACFYTPVPDAEDIRRPDCFDFAGTLLHYMSDRIENRERWLGAMMTAAAGGADAAASLAIVNGPADPVSGAHMVANLRKVMGDKVTVHTLPKHVGHWPLTEAPAETMAAIRRSLSVATRTGGENVRD